MKTLIPLSPTEWRLMRCVWDLREATPPQVADHLRTKLGEELSPKTVGIFLARLEEKGYLRSSPGPASAVRGRPAHVYSPLVLLEDSLRRQVQKFLDEHRVDKETLETVLANDKIDPTG